MAKLATKAADARKPGTPAQRAAARQFPLEKPGVLAPRKRGKSGDVLDRSRDYAILQNSNGGGYEGAWYSQGGFYYDQDGLRIPDHPGEEEERKSSEASMKRQNRHRRTFGGDTPPSDDPRTADTADDTSIEIVPEYEVNLTAWGMGQMDYRFSQVREAIRARFGKLVTNERTALDFLVEEGVITAHDARDRGR